MSDALVDVPAPQVDESTVAILHEIYERDGKLTPEQVLDEPRLRHHFEWDDAVAAHQYRLVQARQLIRSVKIRVENAPVRAFVRVPQTGSYAPVRDAMQRPDWREAVLAEFRRDAEAFERRWKNHKFVADEYARWKAHH